MSVNIRNVVLFGAYFLALALVARFQSPTLALTILNMGLISAIMALGVNMQWGYAGLFNVGIMGFTAVGGLAVVLISLDPVPEAVRAGAFGTALGLMVGAGTIFAAIILWKRMAPGRTRGAALVALLVAGWLLNRYFFVPAVDAIEAVNPALEGNLGGLGLPVLIAWPVGALFAAGAAWLVGKVALGLRSDYLAIATLGISEIIIAILKHEGWLARGVKNVTGLPRPVATPVELRTQDWVVTLADTLGRPLNEVASLLGQGAYAGLFLIVLGLLLWLSENALNSPWGRMMRAIRDNETAARAMGKDVTRRHLNIFVIGSAVCGLAGAMMVTLDGQLNPGTYEPLRFTFLIWVMVIVGGSGNNWGAVLGGLVIWFLWVQVEPAGRFAMDVLTMWLGEDSALRAHLLSNAAHMRLLTMGVALLLVLRFSPRGLIPER
jgi:branched-chain amino acid transport system permease protein